MSCPSVVNTLVESVLQARQIGSKLDTLRVVSAALMNWSMPRPFVCTIPDGAQSVVVFWKEFEG